MKRILVYVLALTLVANVQAQTKSLKQLKTDFISDKVIEYLGSHQSDSIYRMCGDKFKSHISKEDFENISETQLYPINDYKKVTFIKTIDGINKYKVAGTPELQLLVGLDDEFKIETLLIQPYSED